MQVAVRTYLSKWSFDRWLQRRERVIVRPLSMSCRIPIRWHYHVRYSPSCIIIIIIITPPPLIAVAAPANHTKTDGFRLRVYPLAVRAAAHSGVVSAVTSYCSRTEWQTVVSTLWACCPILTSYADSWWKCRQRRWRTGGAACWCCCNKQRKWWRHRGMLSCVVLQPNCGKRKKVKEGADGKNPQKKGGETAFSLITKRPNGIRVEWWRSKTFCMILKHLKFYF